MSWDWRNYRGFKLHGGGDPNQENKFIFYALVFIILATFLYILTFYFKKP